jgi:VWFA-related protein
MKATGLFLALFFVLSASAAGQNRCLSSEDAKKVIESMKPMAQVPENKKIRKELIEMRELREKLDAKIAADTEKNQNRIPESQQMGEKHLLRVCQLLKENGFITRDLVKDDGFDAFLFLIASNKDVQAQSELLPVLAEAAKKGYIGNPILATFVDSIRVASRMPQIFGTQAAIRNNVVYLYPILNEEKVDEWRKMYNLPPLAAQIRGYEARFLMPVLKSQRLSAPTLRQPKKENEKDRDTALLGISDDENEPVKVDTRLVNLNIRVLTPELKLPPGLNLTKEDFTVSENGVEQEISFFSSNEKPFDLVLLLDFSGSTIEKRSLIKKAAQRFVEVTRPGDRIAIVVFTTGVSVISEFTTDKPALYQKIKDIEANGGSSIWDSLGFVYDKILKDKTPGRRSAVVFMTDGLDDSPRSTFADAIETVRRGDTTVFPVYLGRQRGFDDYGDQLLRKAQQSLWMLAEETGGQLYKAADPKDLSGVYEQIVNELGQVYSIGYEPKDEVRDGGWRNLTVRIKTQPNLVVRTRRGYYAD